jgi:hypothetical protein
MNELSVACALYQCRSVDLDGVQALASIVLRHGFEFQRVTEDNKLVPVRDERDLPSLVRAHHTAEDGEDWSVAFSVRHPTLPELNAGFEYYQFTSTRNRLLLSALIDFEFSDQRSYASAYAELVLNVAKDLYPVAMPEYAYVDDDNKNRTGPQDAEKRQLLVIGWVNFWGPAYVEKYGRKTLLGMPGALTQELPDGGVFHQLSPHLTTSDKKLAAELRKNVVEYSADHGLKVKCYAPYVLAGG